MEYAGFEIEDVPVSAALKVVRQCDETGTDEDAVEWAEVQRLLFERDWGPVLALRTDRRESFFYRWQLEDGVDVSAFNSHDFERLYGPRSDAYGAAIAAAVHERNRALWMLEMLLDRNPGRAKYAVLRYVRDGVIDESMIANGDLRRAVYWRRRKLAAQEKIERLEGARWRRGRGPADDTQE